MRIHLFSTDESVFGLLDALPPEDRVAAVVVPTNRTGREKIHKLIAAAEARNLTVHLHRTRQRLPEDLPRAEAGISWLYSQIIATEDIGAYSRGILNMHGGRIPEYRGASVLHWAIVNGETEMGITWHEIVEEVDAGPIWSETTIPIPREATAADMRLAMIEAGIRAFPEAWRRFKTRSGEPRRPDLSRGRVWPMRKPSDGMIGPNWPARRVRDMVRACCPPWPPATVATETGRAAVRAILPAPTPETLAYPTADGETLHLLVAEGGSAN